MIKQYYYKSNMQAEFGAFINDVDVTNFLESKGYTVYNILQKTNQLLPYHEHPSEEMLIVVSGKIRYVIEEDIVDLEAGDIIRIAPNSVHSMIGIHSEDYSNVILVFI